MRKLRPACVAAVLLLGGLLPAPSGAAGSNCDEIDIGPDLSAKPIIVCVGYESVRPTVRVSTDRGRTWTAKQATGTPEGLDHLMGVLVSPTFDEDRTIYLQYQSYGLFASTDGGATFLPADPQGGTQYNQRVTRIDQFGPDDAPVPLGPAIAEPGARAVFHRNQHIPVIGSGNRQELAFRQLGHGDTSVVLNVSHGPNNATGWPVRLARCTGELTCLGGQELPVGNRFVDLTVDPAPSAKTAVGVFRAPTTDPVLWVSTDHGRTYVRNAAFSTFVARLVKDVSGRFFDSVAVLPGGRTWVMRFGTSRETYLVRTDDAGRTWSASTRVPQRSRRIVASPDGRLFGADPDFSCSVDRGRTWHGRCPR